MAKKAKRAARGRKVTLIESEKPLTATARAAMKGKKPVKVICSCAPLTTSSRNRSWSRRGSAAAAGFARCSLNDGGVQRFTGRPPA